MIIFFAAGPWGPFVTIALFLLGPLLSFLFQQLGNLRRRNLAGSTTTESVQRAQQELEQIPGWRGWLHSARRRGMSFFDSFFDTVFGAPGDNNGGGGGGNWGSFSQGGGGWWETAAPEGAPACSPAAAVQKLPITEYISPDQVKSWSVAKLKREAEKAGIKVDKFMEKKDLVAQIANSWGGSSGSNCVVCLNDYEDGDVLRVLPCSHRFHLECIDRWLLARSNMCPLCNKKIC